MGRAVRFFGVAVGLLALVSPARAQKLDYLPPDKARDVFRKYCAECHAGGKNRRADLNLLSSANLLRHDRPLVKPNDPNNSLLLQLVDCGTMPPGTRPKVSTEERNALRNWIANGALPFPPESSEAYTLTKILRDSKQPGRTVTDERYVALNHLLAEEDTAADLDLYRAALAKALNQLSTKPNLAPLTPVDPAATIYRLKLSDFDWNIQPFDDPKNPAQRAGVNLYDLLLLDYPLASLPEGSEVAEAVVVEYLTRANLLRPIPYIRGDWLASAATQAPLYHDMLRLPLTLPDLERRVVPGGDLKSARAAFTDSLLLRGNRLVERRWTAQAAYWRTYDLVGQTGVEALLAGAGGSTSSGAEAIFRLPNGLPGYFIADSRGIRLDAIPAAHLGDKAPKEGLSNGLSCMICHRRGLMPVKSVWNKDKPERLKQLGELYPDPEAFDRLLDDDNRGFLQALQKTLFGLSDDEPLGRVSQRFRQDMTRRPAESNILPVTVDAHPRKGALRDADYVFNNGELPRPLSHGVNPLPTPPIPPLDGIGGGRVAGKDAAVSFEVATINLDTGKPTTTFRPKDKLAIEVKNTGQKPLHFELAVSLDNGRTILLTVGPGPVTTQHELGAGKVYRYPENGGTSIKAPEAGKLTKQRVTIYAAAEKFPAGEVLKRSKSLPAEEDVGDRVLHRFYKIDDKKNKVVAEFDPAKMVRQTIQFETLEK